MIRPCSIFRARQTIPYVEHRPDYIVKRHFSDQNLPRDLQYKSSSTRLKNSDSSTSFSPLEKPIKSPHIPRAKISKKTVDWSKPLCKPYKELGIGCEAGRKDHNKNKGIVEEGKLDGSRKRTQEGGNMDLDKLQMQMEMKAENKLAEWIFKAPFVVAGVLVEILIAMFLP